MTLEEINNLSVTNDADFKKIEDEVRKYCENYADFKSEDVIIFMMAYFKLRCRELGINIPVEFIKDFEFEVGAYNREDDVVRFNAKTFANRPINSQSFSGVSGDNLTSFASMINHELRHKEQWDAINIDVNQKDKVLANVNVIKVGENSPNIIPIARELLATEVYEQFAECHNHNFEKDNYLQNYSDYLLEMEANYFGILYTCRSLAKYNLELAEKYYEANIKNFEKLSLFVYHPENITHKDVELNLKPIKAQYKYSLMCDYVIKNDPRELDEFPILKLLYREDGTKRSYAEILKVEKNIIAVHERDKTNQDKIVAYLGHRRTLLENCQDIINIAIKTDPLLMYQKALYDIQQGKGREDFDEFKKDILNLAGQLDGRYFDNFKNDTKEILLKLSQEYTAANSQSNAKLSQEFVEQRREINELFAEIVEANEEFAEKKAELETQKKDAEQLISTAFNIDINKTEIFMNDDKMYGKSKYDRETLESMLRDISNELSKGDYDKLSNAINLVRPVQTENVHIVNTPDKTNTNLKCDVDKTIKK